MPNGFDSLADAFKRIIDQWCWHYGNNDPMTIIKANNHDLPGFIIAMYDDKKVALPTPGGLAIMPKERLN